MTLNVPPDRPIRTLPERRRAALLLWMQSTSFEDDAMALAAVAQAAHVPRPIRLDAATALAGLARAQIIYAAPRRRK